MKQVILSVILVQIITLTEGDLCPTKTYSLLDTEDASYISCPQDKDPDHWSKCCGPSWDRVCCSDKSKRSYDDDYDLDDLFNPDDWPDDDDIEDIMEIVGTIIGLIVFVVIVTVVCCCCLPCCCLAKRRNVTRGVIHSQAPATTVTIQSGGYPVQQTGGYPVQPPAQPYPPQPQAQQQYTDLPPPYPGPPLDGGYPGGGVQPQPMQGYPAGGYPPYPQPGQPPYPPNQSEPLMSPEYSQKQPAFNPNMQ